MEVIAKKHEKRKEGDVSVKSKGNEKREGLYLIIMSILLEILIDSLRVSSSSSFTLLITLMVVISFVDVTQFPDIKDLEFVLQAVNVCILDSQSSEEKKEERGSVGERITVQFVRQ